MWTPHRTRYRCFWCSWTLIYIRGPANRIDASLIAFKAGNTWLLSAIDWISPWRVIDLMFIGNQQGTRPTREMLKIVRISLLKQFGIKRAKFCAFRYKILRFDFFKNNSFTK